MTIKPNELERLSFDECILVNKIEREIDKMFKRDFRPIIKSFQFARPYGIRYGDGVHCEIVRRYEWAGWDVKSEQNPDYTEGPILRFTSKEKGKQ